MDGVYRMELRKGRKEKRREYVCVCVSVCVREREREKRRECVCVCVCVRERERERKNERMHKQCFVYTYISANLSMCVDALLSQSFDHERRNHCNQLSSVMISFKEKPSLRPLADLSALCVH